MLVVAQLCSFSRKFHQHGERVGDKGVRERRVLCGERRNKPPQEARRKSKAKQKDEVHARLRPLVLVFLFLN